ncbi:hypothetical protein MJO28_009522 [Puccinia striiformis f. sp. tritici]|uniref:Uncharacterized protein n=1 Tax=Puccinia striiformis f. sp. tritici TaxID=168172 RepID=A0ACC0E9B7_9BASI|nr:hypothetical protein MJO28_009522 [Puccinia striiformis f. sp. tritici]KAI7950629.1 hypothetical protein MJO29_009303 [Puccinia striiformis f. sp. tritici]
MKRTPRAFFPYTLSHFQLKATASAGMPMTVLLGRHCWIQATGPPLHCVSILCRKIFPYPTANQVPHNFSYSSRKHVPPPCIELPPSATGSQICVALCTFMLWLRPRLQPDDNAPARVFHFEVDYFNAPIVTSLSSDSALTFTNSTKHFLRSGVPLHFSVPRKENEPPRITK